MKPPIILLLLTILSSGINAQTSTEPREFYSEEFSWRIRIPAGYTSLSGEQLAAAQKKGSDLIEKATGLEVDNQAKVIFAVRSNELNYFESNWQPFTAAFEDYKKQCDMVDGIVFQSFKEQFKDIRMDSTSFTEKISELDFHVFQVRLYLPNNMVMEMLLYCRLFGRKEFSITVFTTDRKTRDELLGAWRSSVFESTKINERRIK